MSCSCTRGAPRADCPVHGQIVGERSEVEGATWEFCTDGLEERSADVRDEIAFRALLDAKDERIAELEAQLRDAPDTIDVMEARKRIAELEAEVELLTRLGNDLGETGAFSRAQRAALAVWRKEVG